ncbi:hypothetical protein BJY18_001851 [Amycolatopsis jiangsuensis]|uniref:Inosine/uridine-preferring nucleoside hydrolase domain-containing protein n=2 Tax=Amycolatopsis jiangsuensis TaxID=1181879 RepID=A0A840IPQ4_9PSEU|nr:hypothetical protein [Amycolatopsis jiangsuensis]
MAEPLTLIPTGPRTNIATVLEQRLDLQQEIKEIIWMGGSSSRGNVGAYPSSMPGSIARRPTWSLSGSSGNGVQVRA